MSSYEVHPVRLNGSDGLGLGLLTGGRRQQLRLGLCCNDDDNR